MRSEETYKHIDAKKFGKPLNIWLAELLWYICLDGFFPVEKYDDGVAFQLMR